MKRGASLEGQDLIKKIKESNLTGRGGAAFPTAEKWQMVLDAMSDRKFVVANGAEGEPNTDKDFYILAHFPEELIKGITLAMQTVGANESFIFLREDYFTKLNSKLKPLIKHLPIEIIQSPGGYRCGEETTLIQALVGKRTEPSAKPPFPTTCGLWGYPTLINNVETLYSIYLISIGKYQHHRFYTISGQVPNPGVFEAPEDITIQSLLFKTKNSPKGRTFAQVGGGASGQIVPDSNYNQIICGTGGVIIHNNSEIPKLLANWSKFFKAESCGRCVPCREGTQRIYDILLKGDPDWPAINIILAVMDKTSFCALGKGAVIPFKTLFNAFLANHLKEKI